METPPPPSSPPSNNDIPHEVVVYHIFSRLSPRFLIRCSCVCKLWQTSILHDTYFLKNNQGLFLRLHDHGGGDSTNYLAELMVSRFFYLDNLFVDNHDDFDLLKVVTIRSNYRRSLVGFCNGLVCLFNMEAKIFEVCNLTKREILAICPPHPISLRYQAIVCCGFGFDSVNNEYKVVVVFHDDEKITTRLTMKHAHDWKRKGHTKNFSYYDFLTKKVDTTPTRTRHGYSTPSEESVLRCSVFTLGTTSWREITIPIPPPLHTLHDPKGRPLASNFSLFCKGTLYWTAPTKPRRQLVSFHLHDEQFQVSQFPAEIPNICKCLVFRETICLAHYIDRTINLYTLKDDNGDEQVWTKETFLLDFSLASNVVSIVAFSDQILLQWIDSDWNRLVFYNVHTRIQKEAPCPAGTRNNGPELEFISHVVNFHSLQHFKHERTPKILDNYPTKQVIESLKQQKPRPPGVAFLFSCSENQDPRTFHV